MCIVVLSWNLISCWYNDDVIFSHWSEMVMQASLYWLRWHTQATEIVIHLIKFLTRVPTWSIFLPMGCWWSLDLTHERENAIKEGGLVCLSTCVWETHAPEEAKNGKFSVCSFALSSSVCVPRRGSGRGYSTFLSTFLRNSQAQAAAALKSSAKTCYGGKPGFPWWCHALSFKPWLFHLRQQENMESVVFIKHNDLFDLLPVIPRLFSYLPSPWW